MRLIPIEKDGTPKDYQGPLTDIAREALQATGRRYETAGRTPPWIGYLTVSMGEAVGICSYKGAPVDGKVEIAYFTFPEFENRGFATQMATELVALARKTDPEITVTAHTIVGQVPSYRILEKLGFEKLGEIQHPQDGRVMAWQLRP